MKKDRHNWGRYNYWKPAEISYPLSLQDLQKAIYKAKSGNLKVRAAGFFHSVNPLCVTAGLQIQMDLLDDVLEINASSLKVKVLGGIKIKKLLSILAKEGLTLPNQGYITEQSIAGAIATATHGSGKTGTLSSFVEEIQLVDAQGELHTFNPSTNEHLFSAAVVNLGCLGIVYSVTLRCISLQKLHLAKVKDNLLGTLSNLPDLIERHDFFQFAINPYSDEVIRWQYHPTLENTRGRWKYNVHWLFIKTLAVTCFDIFPTPWWLLPMMMKIYVIASPLQSCIDYSYKLLSPADEGHYIEEEIAVPAQHFEKALTATQNLLQLYSSQKKRMVALILIRFADADQYGYLSPALGRQIAYISLISVAKEGYKELFQDFETTLYQYSGRPHWGKVNFLTKEAIIRLYGSNYSRFQEARLELDPDGLFSSEYLDRLFTL